ncbi:DUF445 domain-containing protein [Sphingorhabdus arenilitoris]|uniref:DUF445 domain-containing protein n=1 Tax=Sphingorhabdus arenilitoris TaxID=1490041 RepID=A0ABV8RGW8_9SPHN
MRIVATSLLVVMAIIFVGAKYLETRVHEHWGFLRAFAEAGMIGGLADWFAVTALFRYPLGIRIPHTAIIPNNKTRIGVTLANFLRGNFLTTKVVAKRVRNMDVAGAVGRFLANPSGGEGRMRSGASRLLGDMLSSLDDERLGAEAKKALKTQLQKLDIAPLLGQMLKAAIKERRHMAVLDGIIGWSAKTLEANEQVIRDMVEERASGIMKWTGLDTRLADAIVKGLNKLIAEMAADPDHPLREKGEEGLEKFADDLIHDKATKKRVNEWKLQLLDNPAIGKWIDGLWQQGREGLLKAARNPDATMAGQLGKALTNLGGSLQKDERLKRQINRFARRAIVGTTENYGDNIVTLVSDTIEGWDASTITDRVENAVGSDLQFIRINGTLVGGMVGLIIHSAGLLI